jgi:hypothetical protein
LPGFLIDPRSMLPCAFGRAGDVLGVPTLAAAPFHARR